MAVNKLNVYQYGTTVRFEGKFYDFDGNAINPDTVKIIIYDYKYAQIFSATLSVSNQLGVGDYYYDYTTELKEQKLYYEWYGEINGKPSLKRGSFMTRFL